MDYSLSLYQLGKVLKEIESNYSMKLLSKIKLSGGWATMGGKVKIKDIPDREGISGGNNIISLIINEVNENPIKITGLKDLNFKVSLSQAKYKVVNKGGLNIDQIKEKDNKCTLRIDENLIFTIEAPIEKIKNVFDI